MAPKSYLDLPLPYYQLHVDHKIYTVIGGCREGVPGEGVRGQGGLQTGVPGTLEGREVKFFCDSSALLQYT